MGILHTKSSYAASIPTPYYVPRTQYDPARDIGAAVSKEQALYALFGANSFDGFRRQVQGLLRSPDLKIIRDNFSFSKVEEYIKSLPKRYTIKNLRQGSYVTLTVDESQLQQDVTELENDLKSMLEGKEARVSSGNGFIQIHTKFRRDKFVEIINKLNDRKFKLTNKGRFSESFINYIKEQDTGNLIEITNNKGESVDYFKAEIDNPFMYSQKDMNILFRENPKMFYEIFKQIKESLTNLFLDLSKGGSKNLQDAVREELNELMPRLEPKIQEGIWEGSIEGNFFLLGGNLSSGIKGIFGEFQGGLLFKLLSRIYNSQITTSVIGNEISSSGFQPKEDIFLKDTVSNLGFNIQSKMSSENSLSRGSTVYITVAELNDTGLMTYSFADFMANALFNSDFASDSAWNSVQETVPKALEEYPFLQGNLSTQFGLNDNITFYWIENKYLVPASEIMSVLGDPEQANFGEGAKLITNGVIKAKSDEQLREENEGKPLFTKYWRRGVSNLWKPRSENEEEFNRIVNKAHYRSKLRLIKSTFYQNYSLF